MLKPASDLIGQPFRVVLESTRPCQFLQRLLGREFREELFLGILVGQFIELKSAAINDLVCSGKRFRIAGKQPMHFIRFLR